MVLARPPQVDSRGGAGSAVAVGVDQGAVDDDVAVAGDLGGQQRSVQRRLHRGQDLDALVAVLVGGAGGDRVVAGERHHPGVVEKPAQHQHRLGLGRESTGVRAGPSARPLGPEQACHERDAVGGHVQDGFVCDTHSARNSS